MGGDRASSAIVALRRAGLVGAALVGAAGGTGLVAYVQARLAISGQVHTAAPLDGIVRGRDADPSDVTARMVWIGDSLAAGLGAVSIDLSLPRLVAAGRVGHTRLHSFAVPGATSDDVVRTQLKALYQLRSGLAEIGQRVDAIGVTVGANDIGAFTPRARFRRNLRAIIRAGGDRPMVFVSIPQLRDQRRIRPPLRTIAALRAAWLDRAIRSEVARWPQVHYADVRRRPAWIRRRDLRNFLAADRFHPSGAGYAVWADQISAAFDLALP